MKFGFRTPSLKKRIAARTSWKRYVRHNLGVKAPRGWGWLTNPKKAAYNRIYNRTTVDPVKLILGGGRSKRAAVSPVARRRTRRSKRAVTAPVALLVIGVVIYIGYIINGSVGQTTTPSIDANNVTSVTPSIVAGNVTPAAPSIDGSNVNPAPQPNAATTIPDVASDTSRSLEDRLADAVAQDTKSKSKLDAIKKKLLAALLDSSPEYKDDLAERDAAEAKEDQLRAMDSSGVAEAAMEWMQDVGTITKIEDSYLNASISYQMAQVDLDKKSSLIASLKKQIEDRDKLAAQAALAAQNAAAQSAAADSSSTDNSGADAGYGDGKTQHVNGYTRQNGTYVQPYYRSSAR
jgi:hypothetical protein